MRVEQAQINWRCSNKCRAGCNWSDLYKTCASGFVLSCDILIISDDHCLPCFSISLFCSWFMNQSLFAITIYSIFYLFYNCVIQKKIMKRQWLCLLKLLDFFIRRLTMTFCHSWSLGTQWKIYIYRHFIENWLIKLASLLLVLI